LFWEIRGSHARAPGARRLRAGRVRHLRGEDAEEFTGAGVLRELGSDPGGPNPFDGLNRLVLYMPGFRLKTSLIAEAEMSPQTRRSERSLLDGKNAVVYGAGGAIGGAVARAFAREGAKVFLTGRSAAGVEAVANEIRGAGGAAETAQVDALDERAVDGHI